jgi:hypothetical protein
LGTDHSKGQDRSLTLTPSRLLSTQLRIIYSTPQDGNYQTTQRPRSDYSDSPTKPSFIRSEPNLYTYGYLVPRNHEQALELDKTNGNTRWADATDKELSEINEYDTFSDKGKGHRPGQDYKKIRVHLVCGQARRTSQGTPSRRRTPTETPVDSVYSSVVSLRGIRITRSSPNWL